MSTKIYNGFIFKTNDFNKIHKEIMSFRKKIAPIVKDKAARVISVMSTNTIDRLCIGMDELPDEKYYSPFYKAEQEIHDRIRDIKRTQIRDPIFNFSCDISIHPIKNKILGIIFTEQRDIEKMWFRKKIVGEYGYWNNVDPLETVSEKDWDQRRIDWDKALEYEDVPAMNGFGADCVKSTAHMILDLDKVVSFVPDFQTRVKQKAKDFLLMREEKRFCNDKEKMWKVLKEIRKWLESDKGKKMLKETEKEVRQKLVRKITRKHLLNVDGILEKCITTAAR